MLHTGHNDIDGVPVEVVRKRVRCINIRIASDGSVRLSVPKWWATLGQGEDFLREKWRWVLKSRAEVLSRPVVTQASVTDAELSALRSLLGELMTTWSARLGLPHVLVTIRRMKSVWGSCHWMRQYVVFNAELAHAPREQVEYVVVHELTHFAVHNHGPRFQALMDERLPDWKVLRRCLNRREWAKATGEATDEQKRNG